MHHIGGYTSTFNNLDVEISNCNIINITVIKPNGAPGAVLYLIGKPVTITNFIIFHIDYTKCDNFQLIDSQNHDVGYTFKDSVVDIEKEHLIESNLHDITFVTQDTNDITTRPIVQLNLGECKGDIKKTPPPIGEVDDGKDELDKEDLEPIITEKPDQGNTDNNENTENTDNNGNTGNTGDNGNTENTDNNGDHENPDDKTNEIESIEGPSDFTFEVIDKDEVGLDAPKKKKNNAGMIAGVTVGCAGVAGAGIAAGTIFYLKKKSPVGGASTPNKKLEGEDQP